MTSQNTLKKFYSNVKIKSLAVVYRIYRSRRSRISKFISEEIFYVSSFFFLGLITIVLTSFAQREADSKFNAQLLYLDSIIREDRYSDKNNAALMMKPFFDAKVLSTDKPEELPRIAYKAYLEWIERYFASEGYAQKELDSVKTFSDYIKKVDSTELKKAKDKRLTIQQEIVNRGWWQNFLFRLIIVIQIINTWLAFKWGIKTYGKQKQKNQTNDNVR